MNDRFRVSPNGKGSYDVIVPKFKKLVAERGDKDFYLRGTFTRKNLDFAKDVLAIADEGFRQISVEPCRRKISTTTPCGRKICPPSAQNMKSWRRS